MEDNDALKSKYVDHANFCQIISEIGIVYTLNHEKLTLPGQHSPDFLQHRFILKGRERQEQKDRVDEWK